MTSLTGYSANNPRKYLGPNVAICTVVTRNRQPTGADYRQPETGKLYPFNTFWLVGKDPTTGIQGELWYLSKIAGNVAFWVMLTQNTGPLLNLVVPNGVSPIEPDVGGSITFTSTGGTVTITGSTASPNNHFINFDLTGGGIAIDQIAVQANTGPGVNPVNPTAAGLLTINGAVVANHSVPIETRSRALNTVNIEAQYATSAAATDGTKSGLAHFNSTQFSVDASGFVSLTGSDLTGVNQIVTQVFTSNGTYTPTTGMIYCNVECVGGGAGGGAVSSTMATAAGAGGGGSGAYCRQLFSAATIGASKSVTIGAGGAGGTPGPTAGSNGGSTIFGALLTAGGGTGGGAGNDDTPGLQFAVGGAGGTSATGDFFCSGGAGGVGFSAASYSVSGAGGDAPLYGTGGQGMARGTAPSQTGQTGNFYGGGGGGALTYNGNSGNNGGAGRGGIIIVTEYIIT